MTIHIEDLDNMDFSDVTTGSLLPPIHPGEILREEFLFPLNLNANTLALALKVPATRINDIVREKRAITPDTALRLARSIKNISEASGNRGFFIVKNK